MYPAIRPLMLLLSPVVRHWGLEDLTSVPSLAEGDQTQSPASMQGYPAVPCGHPSERVALLLLLKWSNSCERKVVMGVWEGKVEKWRREWEQETGSSSGRRGLGSCPWQLLAREEWEAHAPFSQHSVPTSASSPLLPCGTTNTAERMSQLQSSVWFLVPGLSDSLFCAPHTAGKLLTATAFCSATSLLTLSFMRLCTFLTF